MKKIIIAMVISFCSVANAANFQIGFPVAAARLSLTGHVYAFINCETKSVNVVDSTNVIFERHILKNVHSFCYEDNESYYVKFNFIKGDSYRIDLKTSQPGRFQYNKNKVEKAPM